MPKLNNETLVWEEDPIAEGMVDPASREHDGARYAHEREEAFRVAILNTLWMISRELRDIADVIRERSTPS